jgi:5-methylcytosine-specific restriction endonuclease McrA
MERYTSLSKTEKTKRRKNGLGNFTYVRYADDFVVLCNGGRSQVEVVREELYMFLKDILRLDLSKDKTKITHLNDGFTFLGFHLQRMQGGTGKMTTKITIPEEAIGKLKDTLKQALNGDTQDSVETKILAINRVIRGWCQYYQYTSKAGIQFDVVEHFLFWEMGHWLGSKFRVGMPTVIRRFKTDNTFVSGKTRLIKPTEFKAKQYHERFFKPNPYLTERRNLTRETLPQETQWIGYETRKGWADIRLMALSRDNYTCQTCGAILTTKTAEVDHIRPIRRFKRAMDANALENTRTLCIPCHATKTKNDQHMESRVR